MKVLIPETYIEEKEFVLHHILNEILGCEYTISTHSLKEYHFLLDNGKSLIIKDSFFSLVTEDTYLSEYFLPNNPVIVENNYIRENNLPVLYGTTTFKENDSAFVLDHDLIASSYFLLSRWEEYVIKERDKYDRFPDACAWTVKHKLNHRPLVDEYAAYIRNIMNYLGADVGIRNSYCFSATFDLDSIYKWHSTKAFIKNIVGDIFKRRSLSVCIDTIKRRMRNEDPYDTFAYIFSIIKKKDILKKVYILMSKQNEKVLGSERGVQLLKSIKNEKCIIGIHPDIGSYKNAEQIRVERKALSKHIFDTVADSRQHFLQLTIPYIWTLLERNALATDSSLYFNSYPGFRSGTCTPHFVFDFLQHTTVEVKEFPIQFMDQSLLYMESPEQAFTMCVEIIEACKKYNGTFTFLWHNSSFTEDNWPELKHYFEEIIELASPV